MQAWKNAAATWMLADATAPFKVNDANKLDAVRALSAIYSAPDSQEYYYAKSALLSLTGDLISAGTDGYTLSSAMAWSDTTYVASAQEYRRRINSYSRDSVLTQWEMVGKQVSTFGGGTALVWMEFVGHPEGSTDFEELPHKV